MRNSEGRARPGYPTTSVHHMDTTLGIPCRQSQTSLFKNKSDGKACRYAASRHGVDQLSTLQEGAPTGLAISLQSLTSASHAFNPRKSVSPVALKQNPEPRLCLAFLCRSQRGALQNIELMTATSNHLRWLNRYVYRCARLGPT